MRKTLVTIAAAMAIVAAGSLIPHRAQAMDLSVGIGSAIGETDFATRINYDCRRVWRCGPFGCGFRSACGWRPGFGDYGNAYNSYRPWRYRYWDDRPHWGGRPYWRERWGW